MVYSNKAVNAVLVEQMNLKKQNNSTKSETKNEEIEIRPQVHSIFTQKELRYKKQDLEERFNSNISQDREKAIKGLMDQHKTVNDSLRFHYQKEMISQEDEFNRKMNQRRERSMERSFQKVGSNRDFLLSKRDLTMNMLDKSSRNILENKILKNIDEKKNSNGS